MKTILPPPLCIYFLCCGQKVRLCFVGASKVKTSFVVGPGFLSRGAAIHFLQQKVNFSKDICSTAALAKAS
ncbi:hypothetical protein XENTR_v10005831 [Xenopus tropicalis]|nr:hypothetical protein XENTR_v10005831 [Xenopus tropicalis]